jgi:hypothetical protein
LQRCGRRRQARERLVVDAQRRTRRSHSSMRPRKPPPRRSSDESWGTSHLAMKGPRATRKSTRHNGREIIARERGSASTTAPLIDASLKGGRFRSAESGRRDISLSRGKPNRKKPKPNRCRFGW